MANENYEGFDLTIYNLFTLLREMYYTRGETETNFLSKSGGTLGGSLTIQGNLTVQGNSYKIDTEDLVVKDYTITLAKDNEQALLSMVGMVVPKYDGTNYGFFGWDADGYAYVGDLTDYDGSSAITLAENTSLQKIATIKDTATGTTSDNVMIYDDTNKVFKKAPSGRYIIENNKLVAFDNDYKSLYNLGSFDTISGNTITRQTGYINNKNINIEYNIVANNYRVLIFPKPKDYTYYGATSVSTAVKCNKYPFVGTHTTETNVLADWDNIGLAFFFDSNTTEAQALQNIENIIIEYSSTTIYIDNIIENESILPLDTNMANKIRQKVVDGLNLFDTFQQSNFTDVNGTTTTIKNTSTQQGTITTSYNPNNENRAGYIFNVNVGQKYSFSCSSGDSVISIEDGNGSLYNQQTQNHKVTFIPTTNKIVIRFGTNYTSTPVTISNIILSNNPYPYSAYNQKEHITNDEANLLNNEWKKGLNLLNGEFVQDTYGVRGFKFVCDNTTYYTFTLPVSVTYITINNVDNNNEQVGFVQNSNSITIQLINGTTYGIYVFQNTWDDAPLFANSAMLNSGSHAYPYQEYNGEIVHKADIEPVLLWENSSPNSSFTSTGGNNTITFNKAISNFKYLIFGYKLDNSCAIHYTKVKSEQKQVYLSLQDNTSNDCYHRGFNISSNTTGFFYDGYVNATPNNSACIPVEIYGTNVL